MPKNKNIFIAIMGWGLGHATRCIPIIESLMVDNNVILASNGLSAKLLKQEFSDLKCINFPDYAIRYPRNRFLLLPFIILQIPAIIIKIIQEYFKTQKVIIDNNIDIIISDSRYGVYSRDVPTYFIIHQLRFQLPGIFQLIEILGEYFNLFMFRRYKQIIIPDIKSNKNLTGKLTHSKTMLNHHKLNYLGIFCGVYKLDIVEDIDYFFSISGPEIQRTLFEEIILNQIDKIQGKKVVVLGNPGDEKSYNDFKNTEVYSHVDRKKQNELLNRAKFVICRSGYTTVMELIALNKPALMIPTPGQTEQEYLANHYKNTGLFFIVEQHNLNIVTELNKISSVLEPNMHHMPVNDTETFKMLLCD